MQIYPVDREWVFTYVLEPFEQGCELINLFWNGVDRSLERNALSWGSRLVYLIEGALLLIPFINTVIWLAYKTFLQMDTLVDPFCPESEVAISPPQAPEIIIHRSEEDERAHPSELFGFIESSSGESPTYVSWRFEPFSDGIVVNQTAPTFSTTATYTSERQLREYHYVEGPKRWDLVRSDLPQCTQVHLQSYSGNASSIDRTFELPVGALWVQQRTVGFRPFVYSTDQEIEFYSVIPEYPTFLNYLPGFDRAPCIVKLKAQKTGLDEGLLKVEVTSTRGFPYTLFSSTLWFDPVNGQLKKFIDRGSFMPERQGTYVQSSR